jgi:hypothetical protein
MGSRRIELVAKMFADHYHDGPAGAIQAAAAAATWDPRLTDGGPAGAGPSSGAYGCGM